MSSSDISERSGDHEHDYEDIYLVREESANKNKERNNNVIRSRSKDSGSHSRSGSASSSNSSCNVIVKLTQTKDSKKDTKKSNEFLPKPQKYEKVNVVKNKKESQESGLSSTASTLSSEEDIEKTKLGNRHSMPVKINDESNVVGIEDSTKNLKRVTSAPIDSNLPPPPPPLPANQKEETEEEIRTEEVEVVEEPTVKPSEVVKGMCRSISSICK